MFQRISFFFSQYIWDKQVPWGNKSKREEISHHDSVDCNLSNTICAYLLLANDTIMRVTRAKLWSIFSLAGDISQQQEPLRAQPQWCTYVVYVPWPAPTPSATTADKINTTENHSESQLSKSPDHSLGSHCHSCLSRLTCAFNSQLASRLLSFLRTGPLSTKAYFAVWKWEAADRPCLRICIRK